MQAASRLKRFRFDSLAIYTPAKHPEWPSAGADEPCCADRRGFVSPLPAQNPSGRVGEGPSPSGAIDANPSRSSRAGSLDRRVNATARARVRACFFVFPERFREARALQFPRGMNPNQNQQNQPKTPQQQGGDLGGKQNIGGSQQQGTTQQGDEDVGGQENLGGSQQKQGGKDLGGQQKR